MATGLLYLMPSLHFKTYGILTQLLNLQGLVISVHMSFLQLNHIESVTSQLLWLIKLHLILTCVVIIILWLLH